MRYKRRGITLTELLVVISVITILAAMIAPIAQRAWARAIQATCANNMGRLYQGFQLLANQRSGKLPQCFDVNVAANKDDSIPNEDSWWFRKVGDIIYTPNQNPLRIATRNFRPERCVMRCPASPDHYEQDRTPAIFIPRVSGGTALQIVEKDRVYDNNYGFNNWGFRYTNPTTARVPDPRSLAMGHPGTSPLYHGSGTVKGYYETPVARPDQSYIGHLTDVPYAESTILLMDYIKADIAPMGGSTSATYDDKLYGLRFRHGSAKTTGYDMRSQGQSNVLFVDGHIQGYTARAFATKIGTLGTLNWDVRRRY